MTLSRRELENRLRTRVERATAIHQAARMQFWRAAVQVPDGVAAEDRAFGAEQASH